MKKALKWIGLILASLIILLIVLIGTLHFMGQSQLAQAQEISVTIDDLPTDEAALARGEHLARAISLCADCHKQDFSGKVFIDEPPIGLVAAPNLTRGQGGIGAIYSDEDWVRAIRHGVGGDGRTLGFMPSNAYAHLSDEDLAALMAYLKRVPPVDNELPSRNITFPGTIIFGVMAYGDLPVSLIDHDRVQSVSAPAQDVTAEYGAYLTDVGGCGDCHGARLAGRTDENGPPPGPNLTPAGNLGQWSEEDFMTTMKNGTTPEGKVLDPELMPWPGYAHMTADELMAIWLHLQSLQPRSLDDNGA